MAGRGERGGGDLDDWFDEPEPPTAQRARPNEPRAQAHVASGSAATGDDWLDGGSERPTRRPRAAGLFERRRAIAIVVALAVLLALGLALSGAFNSATPRPATTVTTHAGTTTAATTATQPQSSPTAAAPSRSLKPGDQGSEVKVLQRALASLGYSPGAVDGSYGPSTQHAVAQFQSASNLTADGIVGPQTLAALRRALQGP